MISTEKELIISSDVKIEDSEFLSLLAEKININLMALEKLETTGLIYRDSILSFVNQSHEINFNWEKKWKYHLRQNYKVKKELLAKALGIKQDQYTVLDLTCGTGKDTLLILSFGSKVIAFERKKEVFALLFYENYLMNKKIDNWKESFSLCFNQLEKSSLDELDKVPDALYFDPMFTHLNRKKSALPRLEMQIFDQLVGSDDDSSIFLEEILSYGIKRVVVKRHPKSPQLLKGVTASFQGKNVRYDLYCP